MFQDLNKKLLISNDFYIRTTMPKHKESAQALWRKCAAAGDIYLGAFSSRGASYYYVTKPSTLKLLVVYHLIYTSAPP